MSEPKNPITPEHIAAAQAFAPQSAVYSPGNGDAALIPAQYARGGYHLVYTANTGCFGPDGISGRHNLDNMQKLVEKKMVTVDYINTNYQSEMEGPQWRAAQIPQDFQGRDVPGNQIAHVARGGHSTSAATQLGMALLERYNLSAVSQDVVLVFVADPNDRRKDRVVQHFNSTFDAGFVGNVLSAAQRDQVQHQGRAGAQRS